MVAPCDWAEVPSQAICAVHGQPTRPRCWLPHLEVSPERVSHLPEVTQQEAEESGVDMLPGIRPLRSPRTRAAKGGGPPASSDHARPAGPLWLPWTPGCACLSDHPCSRGHFCLVIAVPPVVWPRLGCWEGSRPLEAPCPGRPSPPRPAGSGDWGEGAVVHTAALSSDPGHFHQDAF